jgi:hypothetical protein
MRRRLQAIDKDSKILVRQSEAKRGRFRVNVKELARGGCNWLSEIEEPLNAWRVRAIARDEIARLIEGFGRELRSFSQRLKVIEKILDRPGRRNGQKGTK